MPADAAERMALARHCQTAAKQLYVAASRWYAEVFAAEPTVAGNLQAAYRYNAACAAALAGCGRGNDAAGQDESERGRLRQQALDWLRGDLHAWRGVLEEHPDKARAQVVQQLQHRLRDPDFDGVRGADALAKLPAAERQSWQQLWADVADTLARSQARAAPQAEAKP